MSVLNDIYQVLLTVKGDVITLPQTPDKITVSNEDKTMVETMVNGTPFTIPQQDGPKTYKFDFSITNKAYPFTFSSQLKDVRFYTDLLEGIKADQNSIILSILRTNGRPNTNVEVLLTDYSYTEDADDLSDYTFSVTFIEFTGQKNFEKPDESVSHLKVAGDMVSSWVYKNTQYVRSYKYIEEQNLKQSNYINDRLKERGV